MTEEVLAKLRAICMAKPEVEERLSHGEPAWFVQGKKLFAMFADHHHDERVAVWCAAPGGIQEIMTEENPERFFRPPYVGVKGWIGVYLDGEVDWAQVEEILQESYMTAAPPKLRYRLA